MPAFRTFLALLLCTSAGFAGELSALNGKTYQGELQNLSDREIVLKTATGPVNLPISQILRLDLQPMMPPPAGTHYTDIELVDGTLLHCTKAVLKGKEFDVNLAGSDLALKIPLTAVMSLLNEAQDPAVRQDWETKILAKRGNQDIVAVKVEDALNSIDGTLGEGNDKGEINFAWDSRGQRRQRAIDPARAFGLVFLRSLPANAPTQICRVYDTNQNVFAAGRIDLGPSGFSIVTMTGVKLELARPVVARLDFSNDKMVFLSDLKPIGEPIVKSAQGMRYPFMTDRSQNLESTQPLQIKGEIFTKGLSLHAYTEVVYGLEGKYRKFEAILGMDDAVGGDGKPLVKIEGDGKELFNKVVTRKDERIPLELDVRGVRQLRIVVQSQRLLGLGDHVDLANAKLSK